MKWNSYFDWCSILISPHPIPPKQRKSGSKNREFESIIQKIHQMDVNRTWYPQNEWPWKSRLLVVVAFSGPEEYLRYCDVDNLSKAALDAYKGIVYEDDRQVFCLIAMKRNGVVPWMPEGYAALTFGVKKIDVDYVPSFVPSFYEFNEGTQKENGPSQVFFQVNGKTIHHEFLNGMSENDVAALKLEVMEMLKIQ